MLKERAPCFHPHQKKTKNNWHINKQDPLTIKVIIVFQLTFYIPYWCKNFY